jgi:uncharacterized protein with FMN-binding domain
VQSTWPLCSISVTYYTFIWIKRNCSNCRSHTLTLPSAVVGKQRSAKTTLSIASRLKNFTISRLKRMFCSNHLMHDGIYSNSSIADALKQNVPRASLVKSGWILAFKVIDLNEIWEEVKCYHWNLWKTSPKENAPLLRICKKKAMTSSLSHP